MEDDHVDRPGVEAPQGVELTGTNSSIGLIALIKQCSSLRSEEIRATRGDPKRMMGGENSPIRSPQGFEPRPVASPFCRPGDYSGVAAPDPIPNSAVKRPSADGTPSQDAGE